MKTWRYAALIVLTACGGGEGADTGDTGDGTPTQETIDGAGPGDFGDSGFALIDSDAPGGGIDSDTAGGEDSTSAASDSGVEGTGSDTDGTAGSDSSAPDTADSRGDSATAADTGTDSPMDTAGDSDSKEPDTASETEADSAGDVPDTGSGGGLRVGDPGVRFDTAALDPRFPQMAQWMTAGVRGGIPFVEDLPVVVRLAGDADSAAINVAIEAAAAAGGGAVWLEDGTYRIDGQVEMKSGVSLVGESRSGVRCRIFMTSESAFFFGPGVTYSGLYRLTIEGTWGTPRYDWNVGSAENAELPGNTNVSVKFKDASDCWIDGVTISNSADFPLRCAADHITMRDVDVDGVFNKQGGAHGYFFILGAYNLVTGCRITHLRHISIQGSRAAYNVLYDNDFRQEVSFHSGDGGNNLIEFNRIVLPADMPGDQPNYFAIMGPWSVQHTLSAEKNYVYRNQCREDNHGGATPWSDPAVVYDGPYEVKPADPLTNFRPMGIAPVGGTLYPVVL